MKQKYILETLEEELRILYVAMTRAKHMLILSCRQSYDKNLQSLHTQKLSWARWLREIGNFK